jgi:uncharacterized membrane protein YhaH (DUF805 family)
MAIKDQCLGCKKHNVDSNFCSEHQLCPIYDGKSCQQYEKRGINIAKGGSAIPPTTSNPNPPVPPMPDPQNNTTPPTGLARFFSSKGRIRRTEYCITYLCVQLFALPMNVLSEDEISAGFALIWLILYIPLLWVMYAQGAKRCHDRGNSGWYQLIPFYIFWMLFAEGDHGRNQYGEDPKA